MTPSRFRVKRQPHKMVKHIQTIVRLLPTNCLSVFYHFVGLPLRGLKLTKEISEQLPWIFNGIFKIYLTLQFRETKLLAKKKEFFFQKYIWLNVSGNLYQLHHFQESIEQKIHLLIYSFIYLFILIVSILIYKNTSFDSM